MDAERRQVTVLFTDVVGFTIFSERSGEEAVYTMSELMDEAVRGGPQDCAKDRIVRKRKRLRRSQGDPRGADARKSLVGVAKDRQTPYAFRAGLAPASHQSNTICD